jgi:MFS family permease
VNTKTYEQQATTAGIMTTVGSTIGLAFGPSVIAVLTVSPFLQPIEQEFGWTRVQSSLAITIVSYMVVLMSPLQGLLADRFGPRRVILTSIPLFALGLAAFYFLPNSLFLYYALWTLIPLLAVGLWPIAYLQAVTHWFDRKLGLALGCANAGIGVGTFIVPLIITGIMAVYDWRMAFLGLAAVVLVISWPAVFFLVREPSKTDHMAEHRAAQKAFGIPFRDAVRMPTFYILNVAFFLLGLTATSLVTQQSPLLVESGRTAVEAGVIVSIFGFGLLVARIFVGFIIDHIFAPRVMTLVSIGGAVSCVLYAAYPQAAIVSAILLGLLLGAEFDVLAFMIKRYFGNVAYGRLYGVIFGVFYLGSGLGIAALSASHDSFGNYDAGLYMAAGVLVVASLIAFLLPRYRYAPGDDYVGHAEPVEA